MRPTVLVVDDEAPMRAFLAQAIGTNDIEVETAAGGPEALELIRRREPEVLIVDLRLKGMSGLELIERARSLAPGTAIIVVSGFGTLEDAVTAGRLGAVDFLPKPFDAATIRTAVERALERRLEPGGASAHGTLCCELDVPSDPGLRAGVFAVLERLAGESGTVLDVSARAALHFCVLETLLNAMHHGHRFERERLVRFRAEIGADRIACEVEDTGDGYTAPEGPEANRRGLALVRALMDEVQVDLGGRRIRFSRRHTAEERQAA